MAIPYPIDASLRTSGVIHVCYEYANLISAAYWSIHGQAPWRTHADDAFLLGYRKLRDFFLKDRRSIRNGEELPDILARDYVPVGSTRTWTLATWEAVWQVEMDKQLAHITFKRDKEWDHRKWVPVLEVEMRTAWAEFLNAADTPYKGDFMSRLSECRSKPGFDKLRL